MWGSNRDCCDKVRGNIGVIMENHMEKKVENEMEIGIIGETSGGPSG